MGQFRKSNGAKAAVPGPNLLNDLTLTLIQIGAIGICIACSAKKASHLTIIGTDQPTNRLAAEELRMFVEVSNDGTETPSLNIFRDQRGVVDRPIPSMGDIGELLKMHLRKATMRPRQPQKFIRYCYSSMWHFAFRLRSHHTATGPEKEPVKLELSYPLVCRPRSAVDEAKFSGPVR